MKKTTAPWNILDFTGPRKAGRYLLLTSLFAAGVPSVLGANSGLGRGDRYSGQLWASRSPVLAQHGMAATEQPLASQIAVDILKKGGSAVDAAIAANAALGLMEPVLNGIGGDCFVIVWDPKSKQLYGYNGSGPSAKGRDLARMQAEVKAAYAKAGMPDENHIPSDGSLSVTVPGTVDTWFALHGRFGKLTMAEDLAPAIAYAENGFPVTQLVARYWKGNFAAFDREKSLIEESANARKTYLIAGHTPVEGEIFATRTLRARFRRSRRGDATPSTRVRSLGPSMPTSGALAGICATRILRSSRASG